MTRFPQIATHVSAADRLIRENHVGPQDDDDNDNDDGDGNGNGNGAIFAAPRRS